MINDRQPSQPITIVLKAMTQKVEKGIHCLECGWPIGAISDKVLLTYDGVSPLESYKPDQMGFINIRCKRQGCKQDYRIEVGR